MNSSIASVPGGRAWGFHHKWIRLLIILATSCFTIQIISAQSKPLSEIDMANRLFGSGKYAEAEQGFRIVLSKDKDVETRGKATFNLGLTLQKLGRHGEAITIFQKLLTQPVDDKEPGAHLMEPYRNYRPRAQWEIGNSLFAQKNYAAAREAYAKTKEKFPFQSWCGNERAEYEYRYEFYAGLCLDHLGKTVDALRQYYRAAFSGRWFYSEPAVHFRIVGIYEEAGQLRKLPRLLDEIDSRIIAQARGEAETENRKIKEEEWHKVRPTAFIRRILELRSFAQEGRHDELIKLLKIQSAVTGPPDDEGNWQAIEAARLLALTPKQSVTKLLASAKEISEPNDRWIAYALGRCGGTEALAWLKQRALREENFWAVRSFIYAISLAGKEGQVLLDTLASSASGNLAVAIGPYKQGGGETQSHISFPAISLKVSLPETASEIQ
ncbi:MAG: tetratricopeptide repeat protein [Verrucomicrobiota bacterium]